MRALSRLARRSIASIALVQLIAPQIPKEAIRKEIPPKRKNSEPVSFPISLAPAIPKNAMIPAAAITLKIKFKTYVLSILLRPFQILIWGMFEQIEHLFFVL